MGEPQRIIKDADGSELWVYYKAGDMVIPKGESTSFFGGGNNYGVGGAFSSEKRPEDRTSRVEIEQRFKIRKEIIIRVGASRTVDGKVVWQNHW